MRNPAAILILLFPAFLLPPGAGAAVYRVGPGRTYETLQELAGLLDPGDLVEVDGGHTYPGGVVFTEPGTAADPIVIRGLRDGGGNRPVISGGTNAVAFETWPCDGSGTDGSHYVFEGFEIAGASFRGIFHQADDLTVRDTVVRDCPLHGILGADCGSGSLTLQYVEVYNCGDGDRYHQVYAATDEVNRPGSVFRMEHCYLHDANGGNNVKSRAERNEIYHNWIEGAYYHQLELVGPDPGGAPDGWSPGLAREDSDVVGNVIWARGGADHHLIRAGGDATGESDGRYRFVNNTIILSGSNDASVFRLFDGLESIEMHNNVFFREGGGTLNLKRDVEAEWAAGTELIAGSNNWVPTSAINVPSQWTGTVSGTDPGFIDPAGTGDLRPGAGSPLVNAGTGAPSGPPGYPFPDPIFPPAFHPPAGELEEAGTARVRPADGRIDIGAFERGSPPLLTGRGRDFNGDGTCEIAVFRESSGLWAVRGLTRAYFGGTGDLPVPADYSGDGTSKIAVFRAGSGLWAVRGETRMYFGAGSDLPVPGDYGGGSGRFAVFRESSGLWAVRGLTRFYFGKTGDLPVPSDYDGDGAPEAAVFRASSGLWAVRGLTRAYFGGLGDLPVPSDYDGDGTPEIAVFRAGSGLWAVRGLTRRYFGASLDRPVPADYSGTGTDRIAVFRGRNGLWAVAGGTRAYFGREGDLPVTR